MSLHNPYRTRKTQGLWVCIILIGLGKPKVCVYIFGIGEIIELLFKQGGRRKKKKNLNLREFHKVFILKPQTISYKRKSTCQVSCTSLGSVTKQILSHHHLRSYWYFYVKLLQINYINQRVVVELVTYWDSCKGLSHVLRSVHHWLVMYWDSCIERKDCRYNISPIGYWGKGLTVRWYFGIGQRVWQDSLYL